MKVKHFLYKMPLNIDTFQEKTKMGHLLFCDKMQGENTFLYKTPRNRYFLWDKIHGALTFFETKCKENPFLNKVPRNRYFLWYKIHGALTFLRQNAGRMLFLDKMSRNKCFSWDIIHGALTSWDKWRENTFFIKDTTE